MITEMPRPSLAHERLMRFVGHWSGPERLAPSPWGPGGPAIGRTQYRAALDGMALIQEYEQEQDGQIVFHGHGIMVIEPDTQDVLWWWFDSFGFPPDAPARGRWDGEVLSFEKTTPQGEARYRYEFAGDRYRFMIENRLPDQTDFGEFMRGQYSRDR